MANFAVQLISPDGLAVAFDSVTGWAPGAISIAVGLLVAWLCTGETVPLKTLMNIGLVFEVVGCFGIAMAQYWGIFAGLEEVEAESLQSLGLSWLHIWIVIFTIVVPSAPRKALLAAIASSSSMPIVFALSMKYGGTPPILPEQPGLFFVLVAFNSALVVLMAYVGARAVYQLGTEVSRARELGSYRLTELLGSGGLGEVWRAKHRMLARPAAIKLVRPGMLGGGGEAQQVALKRFEREAQATAAMRSPHTIELYDFGISDDGAFYYVMELLDGLDLESLVQRFGPVPPERGIHFLRQICHSLGEAHEHELIHRDIKPANVYVCRYGREVDFVKVLDFGLVKSQREPAGAEVKLTAENVAGGTPAYMAPEQVMGDRPVDGRTDIYAIGCVAYWLLTGEQVFQGGTAMKVMVDHLQTPPVPPSQRTELEIPASVENVILSCLEKDPDRRPPSADALSELLAECASDSPVWTPERARHWWDVHQPRSASEIGGNRGELHPVGGSSPTTP